MVELLVVIAVIAVLAALLFPAVASMMARGRSTKCLNYLREIGAASLNYASNNEMNLPVTSHQRRTGGKSWSITLQPYAAGTLCFRCPCDEVADRPYTYAINDFLTPGPAGAPDLDYSKLPRLERPAETILFAELSAAYQFSDHFHFVDYRGVLLPAAIFESQIAAQRHEGAANYVFADGHAETVNWQRVQERLREQGDRLVDPTAEAIP